MSESRIECPKCGNEFSVTEVMTSEIEEKFKKKYQDLISSKDADVTKRLAAIEQEKKILQKKQEEIDQAVQVKLLAGQSELKKKIEAQVIQQSRVEFEDLKFQLAEKERAFLEAQNNEIELIKKTRELEAKEKAFELEMQRRLSEETNIISDQIRKQTDEEHSLKMAEKDKLLEDMKRTIDELKRKSAQGSQQLQGEVLELKIEQLVRDRFPDDEVEEVKKGVRGADAIHRVMMSSGRLAGVILNECKDTIEWGGTKWIEKLKSDMRDKGADIGVIVSMSLPKEIKDMGVMDGIWVCRPGMYPTLVTILREMVIKVKRAELMVETPKDQKDLLFQYMTSNKFAQKIQGICEKIDSMKSTLDAERKSSQKNWKKREIEIEQVGLFMSEMYGELEAVVGKALPRIEALELEAPKEIPASEI